MTKPADHVIIGLHLHNREINAASLQKVLSEYGCNIRTRLGLHEVHNDYCSPNGVILLELAGDQDEIDSLIKKLESFEGIETKTMIFEHD